MGKKGDANDEALPGNLRKFNHSSPTYKPREHNHVNVLGELAMKTLFRHPEVAKMNEANISPQKLQNSTVNSRKTTLESHRWKRMRLRHSSAF
jgi:hypothetical protein